MQGEWIPWSGGECPVPDGTPGTLKFADGEICETADLSDWGWKHSDGLKANGRCITAYRLHTPATQPQAPGMRGEDLAAQSLYRRARIEFDLMLNGGELDGEKYLGSADAYDWMTDEVADTIRTALEIADTAHTLMAERSKRAGNAGGTNTQ